MHRALAAMCLGVALLAAPAGALAQSAGDEQYVDPFQDEGNGREAEQPEQQPGSAPAPEQPAAPAPEQPAAPPPSAEGGATGGEAAAAPQPSGPTLPRTGAPVMVLAAAGYALLLAGIAIRRQT